MSKDRNHASVRKSMDDQLHGDDMCFEDFHSNGGQIIIYYVSKYLKKNWQYKKTEFTLIIRFWECYSLPKIFHEIIFNRKNVVSVKC